MDGEMNPPAFPRSINTKSPLGMTLRDYFAGQAMAGAVFQTAEGDVDMDTFPTAAARDAYDFADAMLAERQKEQ